MFVLLPSPSSPAFMVFFGVLTGAFGGLLVYGGISAPGLWVMAVIGVPVVVVAVMVVVIGIRYRREGYRWFQRTP